MQLLNSDIIALEQPETRVNELGFPGGTVVKNPPANAGDMGSSPGLGDPTCRGVTKPVRHNY